MNLFHRLKPITCDSLVDGREIALFFSGNKHAGENMGNILKFRNAGTVPPKLMCDALSRNKCYFPGCWSVPSVSFGAAFLPMPTFTSFPEHLDYRQILKNNVAFCIYNSIQ